MIQVVIADDHAVVREGLKRILEGAGDIRVVGEATDGPDLLRCLISAKCDAVVMDLAMPRMPGLEALREIRKAHPKLPVLIISMYPADQYAVRTLMAGASGYLNKGDPPGELIRAIRMVMTGRRYLTDEVAQSLAAHVDSVSEKPPHERLSNREFQVLCQLAAGRSVSDIAQTLGLSAKTVSTFRTRVLEKLGLGNNAELIRYGIAHGLVN